MLCAIFSTTIAAGENYNQIVVAQQINTLSSTQQAIFNTLTTEDLECVYNQLSGQQYTNNIFFSEVVAQQFIRRLYDPIRHIVTTKLLVEEYDNPCNSYNPSFECLFDVNHEDFKLWAEGGMQCTHLDNTKRAKGCNINGYEGTFGAQTAVSHGVTLGAAASYQTDHMHYHIPGKATSITWLGGIYGVYRSLFHYLFADLACSYHSNIVRRSIDIGTQSYTTRSKPNIYQMTFYGELGVDYQYSRLLLQPFAGVEVGAYRSQRIVESGSSGWNLTINKKERATVVSSIGLHATVNHLPCHSALNVDVAWNRRLTNLDNKFGQQFSDFGTNFAINGVDLNRNSLDVAVTGSTLFDDHWRFYVEGAAEFWNRAYSLDFVGGVELVW